jgi:hypothetical protein
VEAPEVHGHASHGTGIRWIDVSFGVAALFTSFVSLWVAVQNGHEMDRLVQANSFPYLQVFTSNLESDLKTPALRLTVQNQGIGPARIAEVVVTVDGSPVPDFNTLIDHCCAPGLVAAARSGAGEFAGMHSGEVILSTVRDRMIRPGEAVDAIDWRQTSANRAVMSRAIDAFAGGRIKASVCYCSVFDECWTRSYSDRRPAAAKSCPIASVPYRQ